MKPHIQRSNGGWVAYIGARPICRYTHFRSVVTFLRVRFGWEM